MDETIQSPVPAKPPIASATVMVIRPAEQGFELFMVRRHSKSRFMPDRYVFPGGRLEIEDYQSNALVRLHGFEPLSEKPIFRDEPERGAWQSALNLGRAEQAGLYVAAFRELFEEAGVLLAVQDSTGQPLDLQADPLLARRFEAYRQNMQLDFVQMLESNQLRLDMNSLIYFSHWITPITEPYRFDARFFLTQAPANQVAESDNLETTDGVWLTPGDALRRHQANEFNIAYPTFLHIEWLSKYDTAEAACAAARTKSIVAAMPEQFEDNEHGPTFGLPADVEGQW